MRLPTTATVRLHERDADLDGRPAGPIVLGMEERLLRTHGHGGICSLSDTTTPADRAAGFRRLTVTWSPATRPELVSV